MFPIPVFWIVGHHEGCASIVSSSKGDDSLKVSYFQANAIGEKTKKIGSDGELGCSEWVPTINAHRIKNSIGIINIHMIINIHHIENPEDWIRTEVSVIRSTETKPEP